MQSLALLLALIASALLWVRESRRHSSALESASLGCERWYDVARVEADMLGLSLGVTAVAMALPAFAATDEPRYLLYGFHIVADSAMIVSIIATLWLYRIYLVQLSRSPIDRDAQPNPVPPTATGLLLPRQSGPYALLAWTLILLLIALIIMPLTAFGAQPAVSAGNRDGHTVLDLVLDPRPCGTPSDLERVLDGGQSRSHALAAKAPWRGRRAGEVLTARSEEGPHAA